MKDLFPGFYSPTSEELTVLWRDGLFILDSSVLLKLYEVPERTRQETFGALRKLGNRLWIPHQAALEYQRNRARTIGIAKGRVTDALEPMQTALTAFLKSASSMKLAERGYREASDQIDRIREAGDEVMEAALAAIASHVDINGEDPVRDELNTLLEGKIGPVPTSADLELWTKQAQERFGHRMGPGHLDQEKMKNPTYMMDGLVFDKRYADVYVWKEAIARASRPEVVSVVLITNDSKADWWKITDYGVVGPLPEICAEIRVEAKLESFWMYDLESFLREAETRLDVSVSPTTLSDVAEQAPRSISKPAINLEDLFGTEGSRAFIERSLAWKNSSEQSSRELADALKNRGYTVLKADSDIAVGYKAGEKNSAAIAMQHDFAGTPQAITMARTEFVAVARSGKASSAEILLVGGNPFTAMLDTDLLPTWRSILESGGMNGIEVTVLSGHQAFMGEVGRFDL
ncbi:PIN-like domain-containing protein [Stenotrophomonas indicatrix]|uniref:PIN-like domain-containing protein n=1 Tax=Stenotrophomonas indicatrix TaxID=2045451 RepID=UPI0028AD474E|nr:PIN-like domain-containing protein [Stenotrophomonas indicatrix]